MLGEVEEVELRAEAAVVALARLLEPLEVRVEVGLREERGAVDPGQLRVVLVAAPVGAGEAGQLERLDRPRVLQVRAAAEVGEVALRVERDVALGGVDELDLVRLALGLEARRASSREISSRLHSRPSAISRCTSCLDPLEVGLGDRLRELEVVVEAVLDRRADRDLHARVEPPHRLGEQVRARVAQHVERVGVARVARGQELDRLTVGERQRARPGPRRSRARAPPARRASAPIARAASRPVAPSGSSSSLPSGRMTFMEPDKSNHLREDDRSEALNESPETIRKGS